jgi:hypothetical protein
MIIFSYVETTENEKEPSVLASLRPNGPHADAPLWA